MEDSLSTNYNDSKLKLPSSISQVQLLLLGSDKKNLTLLANVMTKYS